MSGGVGSKHFPNALPAAFASYLECQGVSRERLNVHLVMAGFAPGAGICVTTPHPNVH
jgi:hypothetical protein